MMAGASAWKMVSAVLGWERSQTPNIHHVIKSFLCFPSAGTNTVCQRFAGGH